MTHSFRLPALKTLLFFAAASCVISSCQNEEDPGIAPESDASIPSVNGQIIEGSYIVVLKDEAIDFGTLKSSTDYISRTNFMRNSLSSILTNHRISSDRMEKVFSGALPGFSARLSHEMLERLKNDNRVAYIEPDRVITLSPVESNSANVNNSSSGAQSISYGVTRVGGHSNYTGSGVAFIIDTGIDINHPDLNVDGSIGFNVFREDQNPRFMNDNNGHGTHVAGIIGAKNNSFGAVGVAAGVKVVPVKVLNYLGEGTYSAVIAGIDYVKTVGKSGDVANLSLGGPASQALDDAVKSASKEVKFVISAGNWSTHSNEYSPARVNGPNIFTISAMDEKDNWASFSNYGNPPIDYCAPGVNIYSTWKSGEYATLSGTSMAAPLAAGVLLHGPPQISGYVKNDPDGKRDPIISR